jgi:hypothetical protein
MHEKMKKMNERITALLKKRQKEIFAEMNKKREKRIEE